MTVVFGNISEHMRVVRGRKGLEIRRKGRGLRITCVSTSISSVVHRKTHETIIDFVST
jgi:hypothetical protein